MWTEQSSFLRSVNGPLVRVVVRDAVSYRTSGALNHKNQATMTNPNNTRWTKKKLTGEQSMLQANVS